ncbi:hypothetical protein LUW90_23970, partial [Escherichia coli]|uniref:hypothetical protein n=1 Tax=Escherichia coli TaxID=562 RepID=UPI001E516E77
EMVEGMPHGMVEVFDKMLFMAWEASRAAIVINLPDIELITDTLTAPGDGWEVYDAQKVDKALCDAGIKVKE